MTKIYKEGDARLRRLDAFGREQMEEFPPKPSFEADLPPTLDPTEVQGHTIDHEELRQTILAELRAEAQEKVEQAFKEGQRRGYEAGRKEFLDTTAHAGEMLQEAARQMAAAREGFLQDLEPQVLELIKLACERVLIREVQVDEDLLLRTVRRALEKIADRQRLRVRVSPKDHEALRKHRVKLLEEINGVQELEIVVDEAVVPGGCVVDSEMMHVDARLETLLANVLDQIVEAP